MNKNNDINNITVGITVFDKSLNRVILKQRESGNIFSDKYGIPGGRVKIGENLVSAIRRELYEENRLIIDNLSYIKSYKHQNMYFFLFSAIIEDDNDSFVLLDDIHNLELAPNINDAIWESREFFKEYTPSLDVNIYSLINDTVDGIAKNVIETDGQNGWDHFIFQKRIGIIGTAVGLNILNYTTSYEELKESVYNTLINLQLVDGGWGIKSSENKYSVTESTCICVSSLYGFIRCINEPINKAIGWIKDNRLSDGLWGYNKDSIQGRITTTCVVLDTFHKLGIDIHIEDTINRIIECQNNDGGWGFVNNSPSNLSATSLVVSTLILYKNKNNPHIIKAVAWIENVLRNNVVVDESEIDYIGDKRFEYKHSTKIYILTALLKQKGIDNISPVFLYKSIIDIINGRKKSGFWEHSLTPGYFPIWHTKNMLNLFQMFIDKSNVFNFSYIKNEFENYKIELDCINMLGSQHYVVNEQETIVYY